MNNTPKGQASCLVCRQVGYMIDRDGCTTCLIAAERAERAAFEAYCAECRDNADPIDFAGFIAPLIKTA